MNNRLIKITLYVYFNCKPELVAKYYEDINGNEKCNEIIMDYENNTTNPHWNSYVIIEEGTSPEKIKNWIIQLYECSRFLLNGAKKFFEDRIEEFQFPTTNELEKLLVNNLNIRPHDGVVINLNDFKNTIVEQAFLIGDGMVTSNNLDFDKWNQYASNKQLVSDNLDEIMARMSILTINDQNVEFKIKNNYLKTMEAISFKLAQNLFYKFKKELEKDNE